MIRRCTFSAFKLAAVLLFFSLHLNAAAAPLRIMALGNSITQSNQDHYSYRYPLWQKLLDANMEVDFVGSHAENKNGNPTWPTYKGLSFDADNEGHWGWSADQVLNGNSGEPAKGKLSQWLQNYTPDVVLLHLGTNDMFRNQPLEETLNELREVVRLLRADNPSVTILLAQLIPAYEQKVGKQATDNIKLLNSRLPALAQELSQANSQVVLVDQYSGFNPATGADTFDGVHPNASGEEKMAQRWFDAIMQVAAPSDVAMHNFDADETEQGHIDLDWQTLSEYKSSHFEIERAVSSDSFVKIGEVNASGHSKQVVSYTFQDEAAPYGDLYYRLKHIGQDGKFEHSEVEHVKKQQVLNAADEAKAAEDNLEVYPTATDRKHVTVALNNQRPHTDISIHIYDLAGKLVHKLLAKSNSEGDLTTQLQLHPTAKAGLYVVQVTTNTAVLQDEFILH